MTWQDKVIRAGNDKNAVEQQINEHLRKLCSAMDATHPIISDYCEKFSSAGVETKCRLYKQSATIDGRAAPGSINVRFYAREVIDGTINVEIINREEGYFEKYHTLYWIKTSYGAHGISKSKRYKGPIPESDIEEWIKCATRPKSFLDSLRQFWYEWSS